jgi:hypothetical protein
LVLTRRCFPNGTGVGNTCCLRAAFELLVSSDAKALISSTSSSPMSAAGFGFGFFAGDGAATAAATAAAGAAGVSTASCCGDSVITG